MLAGIALTLISLWYGKNHGLLPPAASNEADLVDGLFDAMMTVSMGIFLLVQGVLVFSVIRFRRRQGDNTDGPPIHGNIPLEIVWTAIPAVIVLVIGVYSFDIYKQMGGFDPQAANDPGVTQIAMLPGEELATPLIDASKAKPAHNHVHLAVGIGAFPEDEGKMADVNVDVMGLQYAWIFTYPDSGITSGELHVPVNQEVQLNIKAQDVLHAFWLPDLRLKQDAIPGRDVELRFAPRKVGEYPVVCAELCGPYHGAMNTKMFVESEEDFSNWIQEQIAAIDDSTQTVAVNSADRTDGDFLKPFVEEMGISDVDRTVLQQLHSHPAVSSDRTAQVVNALSPAA
nr:cytochrome c oxidase subunit II [Oculatella sp. LEGE 06141]